MDSLPPDFFDTLSWFEEAMRESSTPDFLDWAFWFKDSASVRDLLVSLVAVIGIPFLIWREFSTHRTAKAAFNQSQASAEQVKIAARQAEIASLRHEKQTQSDRERRITDSFAKAVELLGSDKFEARLGAIYALERIARESKDDHWPIMETLTAYVLTRLPVQHSGQEVSEFDENGSSTNLVDGTEEAEGKIKDLPIDIRAVLTVLGRRKSEYDAENQVINLRKSDLSDKDLSSMKMIDFNLYRVNLRGSDLSWADLSGATMVYANLTAANLELATLRRTKLSYSNLSKANLTGANLSGANLRAANLSGADLAGADLSGVNLRGANLSEADLNGADLSGANLRGANLRGGILSGTNLSGTEFCKTIMPDGILNNRDCYTRNSPTEPKRDANGSEQSGALPHDPSEIP
jgi:uncharacterized protein YjbI with pentapeptide repeats